MKIRVWAYEVDPAAADEFERAYGEDGAWAQLFAASDGFLSTALYRSVATPGRYVTVDRFVDESAWRGFLDDHLDAYERLDSQTARLTRAEEELA